MNLPHIPEAQRRAMNEKLLDKLQAATAVQRALHQADNAELPMFFQLPAQASEGAAA